MFARALGAWSSLTARFPFCRPEPQGELRRAQFQAPPIVALLTLLQRRFPGLDDPERLIKEGAVLVDGVPAASPRTQVRADAAIRIRQTRLAVAEAIGQLDRRLLAPDARLIALVKPTFELHAAALADQPEQVSAAVAAAARGLAEHGWRVLSQARPRSRAPGERSRCCCTRGSGPPAR
ncbi:MAG: hypothetical protein ACRDRJ_40590 [Streptosporangiaceae bacterium]